MKRTSKRSVGGLSHEKQAAEIQKVIQCYAKSYAALQDRQEKSFLIPVGDQKTGCIGEFYVYLYLTNKFPQAKLEYGNHSQKGWDIQVAGPDLKVQVKTVSAYSTTRTMSHIGHGWDELHVVYLNKMLKPEGFWIIRDSNIVDDKPLKSKKCPLPGKEGTGSKDIPFGDNLVEELNANLP